MFIDLSLKISKSIRQKSMENERMASLGHLGTHFDVMDKEFPLSYLRREAIVFDVSAITGRDIELEDIEISKIEENMFVGFHTGYIKTVTYGSQTYFKNHPQLSHSLIDALLEKKISIIGIDFAGVRRGREHTPKDQYCADKGVFIVENLCNLEEILRGKKSRFFIANTYPIHFEGMSGLPCRVVAEIEEE